MAYVAKKLFSKYFEFMGILYAEKHMYIFSWIEIIFACTSSEILVAVWFIIVAQSNFLVPEIIFVFVSWLDSFSHTS